MAGIAGADEMTKIPEAIGTSACWQSAFAPVPLRYRGVWRRTLLQTVQHTDTATIVFWLQTANWHADLRIPAQRPDFSGVASVAACNVLQMAFLAGQQGFAGATEVTASAQGEICAWHRLIDLQPPATGPDAGRMAFTAEHLIETGLHARYLEHWVHEPASAAGSVVLQRLQDRLMDCPDTVAAAALPVELLLVAGEHVMHVRDRAAAWPSGTPPDATLAQMPPDLLIPLLDVEIALGHRTASGWHIDHATHPWLEGTDVGLTCDRTGQDHASLTIDGVASRWQVLEWCAR